MATSSSEPMEGLDLSRVVRLGSMSPRNTVFLESPRTDRAIEWVRKICGKRNFEIDIHQYLYEKQQMMGANYVISLIKVESRTLVMEKCIRGDMFRFIIHHPLCLLEPFVFGWVHDIAHAIAFMHKHNTFHNDIKPENCFLAIDADGKIICKLGDFGYSRFEHHRDSRTHSAGTKEYAAPEVIRAEERRPDAPDVWSFAATTHSIHMSNCLQLEHGKVHMDRRTRLPHLAQLRALISNAAHPQWHRRPTILQVLKFDYFQAYETSRITLFEYDCLPWSSV